MKNVQKTTQLQPGTPEQRYGGAVKDLREMETFKKQKHRC